MEKLSQTEFITLLKTLLFDALYPDYVHIPGIGIRMSCISFLKLSEDLYKAYSENGENGIILFFEKLKTRPDINIAVERTKNIIYSHLDTLGIKSESDKQKYVSSVVSNCKNMEG